MPVTKPQQHHLPFQELGPVANSLQHVAHFREIRVRVKVPANIKNAATANTITGDTAVQITPANVFEMKLAAPLTVPGAA